jgi:hypothetical protein
MPSSSSSPYAERRGVAWVLQQAAILAVLSLVVVHFASVICLASAERRLRRAAEASIVEAALPAASAQTVRSRAMRKLRQEGFDTRLVSVDVHCNGQFVGGLTPLRAGDEVLVTIAAPGRISLPGSIERLVPWLAAEDVVSEARIVVR